MHFFMYAKVMFGHSGTFAKNILRIKLINLNLTF